MRLAPRRWQCQHLPNTAFSLSHPYPQPYRAQWYEFVKDCALFQWGASVS